MALHNCGLRAIISALLLAMGSSSAALAAPAEQGHAAERPALGLMGTIPIYWGESDTLEALIDGSAEAHWARRQLEHEFHLKPLAVIDAAALEPLAFLLLAQPRALAPAENVALDLWVRGGGRLLLFADPMMTGHSRFGIGDRRRPQDVTLLSPLLNHWGLPLLFDDAQPSGTRQVSAGAVMIPVSLAGHFAATPEPDDCTFAAGGVLARCRIGKGFAVVLADAALLDQHDSSPTAGAALNWLTGQAFGFSGEKTGSRATDPIASENSDNSEY